jgi:tetratricopeptide (TPR) repeat protein
VLRRVVAIVVVVACAAGVVAYQATRPAKAPADPRVFVPSPGFFLDFSPSFRTSIADAYYLNMVQYYGEHVEGDGRLDSLPQMVDLVTRLSPHFTRAYLFGAFGLIDAGKPEVSYKILRRGFAANPGNWRFPSYLGFFAYAFASNKDKDRIAADWYSKAAAIPGSPAYLKRLAAALLAKGGESGKAILMWGQVYLAGDKYSRQKAVAGLERILPKSKQARMKAVAPLRDTMPEADFNALIAELFAGYAQ